MDEDESEEDYNEEIYRTADSDDGYQVSREQLMMR